MGADNTPTESSSARIDARHHPPEDMARLLDEAQTLFVGRIVTIELLHHLAGCLNAIDMALLGADSYCERAAVPAELTTRIRACLSRVRDAKSALSTARECLNSHGPIARTCLLMKDVVRPAVARTSRRITGSWSIKHYLGHSDYKVSVDPILMQECIAIVLNNAVWAVETRFKRQHHRKRVSVLIRKEDDHNHVRVVIRDNGVGIPRELHKRVFDPFFTTRGETTTGLGLFLAKCIVARFGGTIELARSASMKGTKLVISLPARTG